MKEASALDPIWRGSEADSPLINLRLHVSRLCFVANELRVRCGEDGWEAISENLHLAASLRNLQADTDLSSNNYMCGGAADFDEALSILSERHLAGIIVFNLCWSAYEGGVELVAGPSQGRRPKGALGRDLLRSQHGDGHFPWLKHCILASVEFFAPKVLETPELRTIVHENALAAVAAELLRSFRNDVAHGSLKRPHPEDWGKGSEYKIDEEPAILRFHHHTRLLLLLIQIMMLQTDAALVELSQVSDGWASATDVVTQLHCVGDEDCERDAPELDLGTSRIRFSDY